MAGWSLFRSRFSTEKSLLRGGCWLRFDCRLLAPFFFYSKRTIFCSCSNLTVFVNFLRVTWNVHGAPLIQSCFHLNYDSSNVQYIQLFLSLFSENIFKRSVQCVLDDGEKKLDANEFEGSTSFASKQDWLKIKSLTRAMD